MKILKVPLLLLVWTTSAVGVRVANAPPQRRNLHVASIEEQLMAKPAGETPSAKKARMHKALGHKNHTAAESVRADAIDEMLRTGSYKRGKPASPKTEGGTEEGPKMETDELVRDYMGLLHINGESGDGTSTSSDKGPKKGFKKAHADTSSPKIIDGEGDFTEAGDSEPIVDEVVHVEPEEEKSYDPTVEVPRPGTLFETSLMPSPRLLFLLTLSLLP